MPTANPRLKQIADEAEAAAGPGGHAIFKWTCLGCGERAAFNEPDKLYTEAVHTEKMDGSPCGHVTDLNRYPIEADVGYMLVLPYVGDNPISDAIDRRDATRRRN